jgi:hypothetical protein
MVRGGERRRILFGTRDPVSGEVGARPSPYRRIGRADEMVFSSDVRRFKTPAPDEAQLPRHDASAAARCGACAGPLRLSFGGMGNPPC